MTNVERSSTHTILFKAFICMLWQLLWPRCLHFVLFRLIIALHYTISSAGERNEFIGIVAVPTSISTFVLSFVCSKHNHLNCVISYGFAFGAFTYIHRTVRYMCSYVACVCVCMWGVNEMTQLNAGAVAKMRYTNICLLCVCCNERDKTPNTHTRQSVFVPSPTTAATE